MFLHVHAKELVLLCFMSIYIYIYIHIYDIIYIYIYIYIHIMYIISQFVCIIPGDSEYRLRYDQPASFPGDLQPWIHRWLDAGDSD